MFKFEENGREKLLVLLACCFALFMAMLDNTVVNVALPTIQRDLGSGVSGLQWIIDAYTIAFASLLLTGGILGDRFGRKRLFLAGLAGFTLGSLLCAVAPSIGFLIFARAVQGIGASFLLPGSLAILTNRFEGPERAQAIGLWAGFSALALALGPTIGGLLVEKVSWQSVFYLNIPIGLAGLVVGWFVIKESKATVARRVDVPGLLLGSVTLLTLVWGLVESGAKGWTDPLVVASFVIAVGSGIAFVVVERRRAYPMLPLHFFREPTFAVANFIALVTSFAMFGTFFFASLFFQTARGYTSLEAGVRFLPMTCMVIVTAPLAGRLAGRVGSRLPMTIGLLLAGTGQLFLTQLDVGSPYLFFVPCFMLMGTGMGLTMAPMTAAVMSAVGPERAGLGSAVTNTAREVGGSLGIALLGTLVTTRFAGRLAELLAATPLSAETQAAAVEAARNGTLAPAANLEPEQAAIVGRAVGEAFTAGFHMSMAIATAVLWTGSFLAFRYIQRGPLRPDAREPVAVSVD